MKKLLLVLCVLLMATVCFAGTKTLEFTWGQDMPEDIASWNIYMATESGNYTDTPMFAVTKVGNQTEYTSDQTITSPDGESYIYYFVITAVDIVGNESFHSNEASVVIDFERPNAPYSFTVRIINE